MVPWRYIAVLYAQCFGIPALTMGIIGDILNIFIFASVRTYRQTPSTFYLLCAVIGNFIHLTIAITTRILSIAFNNDLTRSSLAWCKMRQFIIATYAPLALTCESLAAIDQFLVTSRNARLRQLSSMKNAYRIVASCVICWHLHSVPFLVYNEIQSTRCVITNGSLFTYWSSVHFFCVLMALPTITLITFGILAYKNVRGLTNTGQVVGADRQLALMICLQLILVILSTIPYGIYNTYILITSNIIKNAEQNDQDFLFLTVTSLLGVFNFGGSFYVYLAASKRFREMVRERLFFCWKKTNEVHPSTAISVKPISMNPQQPLASKAPMRP